MLINFSTTNPASAQSTNANTQVTMVCENLLLDDDNAKIFPQRLMEILSEPNNHDAIAWLPHGKAFIIINRCKFANEILPKYFRKTKYTSFTRKLNRWNFVRVTRGPELGSYYHEFFQRGNEALCTQMYCKNERAKFAVSKVSSSNKPKIEAKAKQNANEELLSRPLSDSLVALQRSAVLPQQQLHAIPRPMITSRTTGHIPTVAASSLPAPQHFSAQDFLSSIVSKPFESVVPANNPSPQASWIQANQLLGGTTTSMTNALPQSPLEDALRSIRAQQNSIVASMSNNGITSSDGLLLRLTAMQQQQRQQFDNEKLISYQKSRASAA